MGKFEQSAMVAVCGVPEKIVMAERERERKQDRAFCNGREKEREKEKRLE